MAVGLWAAVLCPLLPENAVQAAPPSVRNVNLRGLQAGGVTTLVIDGADLLPNPRVVMSVPIAAQAVRPDAAGARLEIDLTLDAGVAPGLYNLFLATDGGISERTVVAVDALPQRAFAEKVETLPLALHGTLPDSRLLRTSFAARAGQKVACEVESQRLGAKVRPVLHLYGPDGKHLAWSLPSPALRGDARLSFTAPADGQYTLTLNDLQYAPPAPNYFRLKIGEWQYADAVFPAAVERGKPSAVRLIGSLPGGDPLPLPPVAEAVAMPIPWPAGAAASGPAPAVLISDVPELIEQPAVQPQAATELQELAPAPSAMNGQLAAAGEEDRYRLAVQPGTTLRFELFAARLGSPLDTMLEVRKLDGAVLAANDDGPGTTDSVLDFSVPADVPLLVLAVKDAHGRGGDNGIYRLAATVPSKGPAQPDFQLSVDQDRYNLPQNGRQVVRVRVARQGYQGPIRLDFGALPPGVSADSQEIAAGATAKLVTLMAAGDGPLPLLTSIRGRAAAELPQPLVRLAHSQPDAVGQFQPWLADELALALGARGDVAFDADWAPAAEAHLVLGGKLPTPARCVRPAGYDGPVRLTLLTSQVPPQVNGQDDPNRTLRTEPNAPNEIAPDAAAQAAWDAKLAADKVLAEAQAAQAAAAKAVADAQTAGGAVLEAATKAKAEADARVTDAEQKLAAALEAAKAAAAAAKNEADYSLLVPADLPAGSVEVSVRAELLSRDRQRVLMTVCTPVRALPVFNPLKLHYSGQARLSATLDPQAGATFKLAGTIERQEGMAGEVAVTLTGLPAGVPVPRVVVAADQTAYELELKFPANTAPAELRDVKLLATGKMTPASPLDIQSEPVIVVIELLPPQAAEPAK